MRNPNHHHDESWRRCATKPLITHACSCKQVDWPLTLACVPIRAGKSMFAPPVVSPGMGLNKKPPSSTWDIQRRTTPYVLTLNALRVLCGVTPVPPGLRHTAVSQSVVLYDDDDAYVPPRLADDQIHTDGAIIAIGGKHNIVHENTCMVTSQPAPWCGPRYRATYVPYAPNTEHSASSTRLAYAFLPEPGSEHRTKVPEVCKPPRFSQAAPGAILGSARGLCHAPENGAVVGRKHASESTRAPRLPALRLPHHNPWQSQQYRGYIYRLNRKPMVLKPTPVTHTPRVSLLTARVPYATYNSGPVRYTTAGLLPSERRAPVRQRGSSSRHNLRDGPQEDAPSVVPASCNVAPCKPKGPANRPFLLVTFNMGSSGCASTLQSTSPMSCASRKPSAPTTLPSCTSKGISCTPIPAWERQGVYSL